MTYPHAPRDPGQDPYGWLGTRGVTAALRTWWWRRRQATISARLIESLTIAPEVGLTLPGPPGPALTGEVVAGGRAFRESASPGEEPLLVVQDPANAARVLFRIDRFGSAATLEDWDVSPSGVHLAVWFRREAEAPTQLVIIDVATGELEDGPRQAQEPGVIAWIPSSEDRRFCYPEPGAGLVERLIGSEYWRVVPATVEWQVRELDVSGDGRWLLVTRSPADGVSTVHLWNRSPFVSRLAADDSALPELEELPFYAGAWPDAWFSPEGLVTLIADHISGQSLVALDPDAEIPGGVATLWEVSDPQATITDADETISGVIVVVRRNGTDRLLAIDLATDAEADILPLGWVGISSLHVSGNGQVVYFDCHAFTAPAGRGRYDLTTGEVTLPDQPRDFLVAGLTYPSANGGELPLFLLHRADITPDAASPTVLIAHGGLMWGPDPYFDPVAVELARSGATVVFADVGDPWSGRGPRPWTDPETCSRNLAAVTRALDVTGVGAASRRAVIGIDHEVCRAIAAHDLGASVVVAVSPELLDERLQRLGVRTPWDPAKSRQYDVSGAWRTARTGVTSGIRSPHTLLMGRDDDAGSLDQERMCAALQSVADERVTTVAMVSAVAADIAFDARLIAFVASRLQLRLQVPGVDPPAAAIDGPGRDGLR